MAERRPLPDAPARDRAAAAFDRNLVLLAGAGTGKTSLLVERLLVALGAGRVRAAEVAALTFTEKAAGEMRERLAIGLERLRRLASGEGGDPGDADADRAWLRLGAEPGSAAAMIEARALAALEQFDGATVETIHAFCRRMLAAFPVEAGVDPGFAVDAGGEGDRLREEAWERFLERELGPEARRAELWTRLLAAIPLDDVTEAALAIASFGIPLATLEPARAMRADELLGASVDAVLEALDAMLVRQRGLSAVPLAFLEGVRDVLRRFEGEGPPGVRAALDARPELAARIDGESSLPSANARLENVAPEELERLAREARDLCRVIVSIDDDAIAALIDAVTPFAREARDATLRAGLVDYDGLLVLARDLLRDVHAVRRAVKRRYRVLLVDEFQDNDPLQYEIALLLGEETEREAADPFEAVLEPGRLFVVGDPKQSIYRFRGADHAAYAAAIGRMEAAGADSVRLEANFRSRPGVIDPINRLFSDPDGPWQPSDFQGRYAPIVAVRPQAPEPGVEIWTVDPGEDRRAASRRRAEGEAIAAEIERLRQTGEVRGWGEITLLFRATTQLAPYLRPLRQREIPFVVEGGREFLNRPEVGHLLAALSALARPSDETALLAFLRSPAGAVSDVELASWARAGGTWRREAEPPPDRFPRLAASLALLRALADETRDLPPDTIVRRVIDRTGLRALSAAAFEGAQRVANLNRLAEAAAELGANGRLSLDELVDAITEARSSTLAAEAPLADATVDAVRVVTIHAMKGLESPVVIVPDLARGRLYGGRAAPARIVRPTPGRDTLAIDVGGKCNAAGAWAKLEDARHDRAEEARVLYVALTRARERLVLVAGLGKQRGESWTDALAPWGYDPESPPEDGALLDGGRVLHRRVTAAAGGPLRAPAGPELADDAVRRFEEARERLAQAAARTAFTGPSTLDETDSAPSRSASSNAGDAGRIAGLAIHRLLERWRGQSLDEASAELEPIVASAASEAGVDPAASLAEAREILERFVDSPLAARLATLEPVGRELPLLAISRDDRRLRGSIDLLYRDPDGALVVADFKSDRESGAETLLARHGAQLTAYAEGVADAFGLEAPPRAEIWSLRSGEIVTVGGSDPKRRAGS